MKGYYTSSGYMGYVPSKKNYQLFVDDYDYIEYLLANEEEF